jgi:hypothetical protein
VFLLFAGNGPLHFAISRLQCAKICQKVHARDVPGICLWANNAVAGRKTDFRR